MKKIYIPLLLAAAIASGFLVASEPSLKELASNAVLTDSAKSSQAIAQLRARGPAGLQALLETHVAPIATSVNRRTNAEHQKRVFAAIDAVGQQKDCYASGLFWFTDFEQAKAAANQNGKPILSLRLLGKLDEEFSCANSRFFRTTLYPNPAVSQYLRDNFVLHWRSVRPVPRVTIDFGDGRKLERTITGNSIHYILSPDGKPIDALPGLYSAKAFLTGLSNALHCAKSLESLPISAREEHLASYHRERLAHLDKNYLSDVAKVNESPDSFVGAPSFPEVANAKQAGAMAFAKGAIEVQMVGGILSKTPSLEDPSESQINDPFWSRIATLHSQEWKLDTNSLQLVASKNPTATAASRFAITKGFGEDPMLRVLMNLERSIAEDTVRNEYILHRRIHKWFVLGQASTEIEQLNRKVYADLFLTPNSDPWLGLVPASFFSGLQDDGLVRAEN